MLHHMLRAAAGARLSYYNEVLSDSPVAWWRFEEASGSTAADETGNGHTGTVFGANLNEPGQIDSAALFDGIDDYIQIPYAASLNTSVFTAECIFRADTAGSFARIMSWRKGTNVGWETYSDDGAVGFVLGSGTSNDQILSAAGSITLGTVYHLAAQYDTGGAARLYLNGTEVASQPMSFSPNNTTGARIGNILWTAAGQRGFDGMIDEPAIYDKALSSARILAHAQAAGLA